VLTAAGLQGVAVRAGVVRAAGAAPLPLQAPLEVPVPGQQLLQLLERDEARLLVPTAEALPAGGAELMQVGRPAHRREAPGGALLADAAGIVVAPAGRCLQA